VSSLCQTWQWSVGWLINEPWELVRVQWDLTVGTRYQQVTVTVRYFRMIHGSRVIGCMIGWSGFDSWRGLGIFLLATESRPTLRPTKSPIPSVLGFHSLRLKRQGRETDHSPPYNAEVEECVELYLHSPNTPSWCGAQVKKHRDNFTFLPSTFRHW
jgi:hypothetical protein